MKLEKNIDYYRSWHHGPDEKCKGTVCNLVIDSQILAPYGVIPPIEILNKFLSSGGGDAGMSPGCTWEPLTISEDEYWECVERIQNMAISDFEDRDIFLDVNEIQVDYEEPKVVDVMRWCMGVRARFIDPK